MSAPAATLGQEAMTALRLFLEDWFERQFSDEDIRLAAREFAPVLQFGLANLAAIEKGPAENGKYDISPAQALYFGVFSNRAAQCAALIAAAVSVLTSS